MTKEEIGYLLENGFTVADIMAMTSTGAQKQEQEQEQEQKQAQEQEQKQEQAQDQKQEQAQEQDQHSKDPGWTEVMNAIAGLTKAVQNGNIFHSEQSVPQEQSIEDTMRILVFGKNKEG